MRSHRLLCPTLATINPEKKSSQRTQPCGMIIAGTERHDGCVKKDDLAVEEELPQDS